MCLNKTGRVRVVIAMQDKPYKRGIMNVTLHILFLCFLLFTGTFLVGCGQQEKERTSTYEPSEATTKIDNGINTWRTTGFSQPQFISWDQAKYHIGERTTVLGPVKSTKWATGSKGQPTFLNIGNPYPNPNRFTVVIWGRNRSNFPFAPAIYYAGKTILVTGLIEEYKGVPEIEVVSPTQIQEF